MATVTFTMKCMACKTVWKAEVTATVEEPSTEPPPCPKCVFGGVPVAVGVSGRVGR